MRLAHNDELKHIKRAAGVDFAAICEQVRTGVARLVECAGCYCVLRIDPDGLCVVCAQGVNLGTIAPHVKQLAITLQQPSIVFHTKRKALKRLLRQYNFNYEMTDTNGYFVYRMRL